MGKIAELKKINELLQSGAIDKEEFELMKGKILGVPAAKEDREEPAEAAAEVPEEPEPPEEEIAEVVSGEVASEEPEEESEETTSEEPASESPAEAVEEPISKEPEVAAEPEPIVVAEPTSSPTGKKSSKAPLIIGLVILVLGAITYGLNWYAFRTMENEKFITTNGIKMRQYPDTDSEVIGKFPFKTRFRVIKENSDPDPKDRYWAEVEVIGSMGWFNAIKGWMVIKSGTIWWAMDEQDCLLIEQIMGNDEAHERLASKYRNALLSWFKKNQNLMPQWKIFMQPAEEENQLITFASFGISENDKKGKSQDCFVCIIQNKEESERKLLVFGFNEQQVSRVVYDMDCEGCHSLNVLKKEKKITYGANEITFVPVSDVVEVKHHNGRYLLHFDNYDFIRVDDPE